MSLRYCNTGCIAIERGVLAIGGGPGQLRLVLTVLFAARQASISIYATQTILLNPRDIYASIMASRVCRRRIQ